MSDSTLSTLEQIRIKVRRLTRSPSANQLSDQNIDDYVNTFVLCDFPEHLRISALRTNFFFYTQPYKDVYENDTTNLYSPLYNFINKYTTFHPPIYVNGFISSLTLNATDFYASFPKTSYSVDIGTGDGATTSFSGTLSNVPILVNSVQFSSVDISNDGLIVYDDGLGNLYENTPAAQVNVGNINYQTGAYTFTFLSAVKDQTSVYAQTYPFTPSKPTLILYYDNKFTVRPIPDRPYKIEMEAYIRPTELLSSAQSPELAQWWQYIAYGAAKKVFEDRMDLESVSLIMPEYTKQEELVQRRSIVQQSDQRSATIYSNQTEVGPFSSNKNDGNPWI